MFDLLKVKLLSLYLEDPCGFQPNPLWKTYDFIDQFQSNWKDQDGIPSDIIIWNHELVQTIWNESKTVPLETVISMATDKLIVHHSYQVDDLQNHFKLDKTFFRVRYNNKFESSAILPTQFEFQSFNFNQDIQAVTILINSCYQDITLNQEEVRRWIQRPVFKKELWVWIIYKRTGLRAGLGIAEVDNKIPEGSLEWIQILPKYRRKGLGTCLVTELVERMKQYTNLITVSGEVDNPTNPIRMYKDCGFVGDDQWLIMKRKTGN